MNLGLALDVYEDDYIKTSEKLDRDGKRCGVKEEFPSWKEIVPQEGLFLGLDISETSTGITIIRDGERESGNIILKKEWESLKKDPNKEVKIRRLLKEDLKTIVTGEVFDLIIIEDVFIGENPEVVRLLFALNTAIDELILDGVCECKKFKRVNNREWKGWLYTIDKMNTWKGYNDKVKIEENLRLVGIEEEGEGYQDRLDSSGLIVGYFLKRDDILIKEEANSNVKVRWSDIDFAYEFETGDIFMANEWLQDEDVMSVDIQRVSKKRVMELLQLNPLGVFLTKDLVVPGNIGKEKNLNILEGGGYLGFWIKKNRRKRYIEK